MTVLAPIRWAVCSKRARPVTRFQESQVPYKFVANITPADGRELPAMQDKVNRPPGWADMRPLFTAFL
jgi:hypothetical protein